MHGGATPSGLKAAMARKTAADAAQILARLEVEPVADPLSELSRLAGQVCAWRDVMADKVNELTSIRYSGIAGEQLRAEVSLFERAMDRCTTVLTHMARLKIDDRLARISERQAALVEAAVAAALIDTGIEPEQRDVFQTHLTRRLQLAS